MACYISTMSRVQIGYTRLNILLTTMSKMLTRGDKTMLRVRRDICLGCGLCVESCPQQAILIVSATVQINQDRCNQCRLCLDFCPQGAIMEVAPVSGHELQAIVSGLKNQAEDIIARIERFKAQQRQS